MKGKTWLQQHSGCPALVIALEGQRMILISADSAALVPPWSRHRTPDNKRESKLSPLWRASKNDQCVQHKTIFNRNQCKW